MATPHRVGPTLESAVHLPPSTVQPWCVRIRHHQFLRLHERHAICMRSERGTLWLTVDGTLEDIELGAGQCRTFDARAPITVGTLGGDAIFSIKPQATRQGPAIPRWRMLALQFIGLALKARR